MELLQPVKMIRWLPTAVSGTERSCIPTSQPPICYLVNLCRKRKPERTHERADGFGDPMLLRTRVVQMTKLRVPPVTRRY